MNKPSINQLWKKEAGFYRLVWQIKTEKGGQTWVNRGNTFFRFVFVCTNMLVEAGFIGWIGIIEPGQQS